MAKGFDAPDDHGAAEAATAASRPVGGRVVPPGARAWPRTLPSLQQVRTIRRRPVLAVRIHRNDATRSRRQKNMPMQHPHRLLLCGESTEVQGPTGRRLQASVVGRQSSLVSVPVPSSHVVHRLDNDHRREKSLIAPAVFHPCAILFLPQAQRSLTIKAFRSKNQHRLGRWTAPPRPYQQQQQHLQEES